MPQKSGTAKPNILVIFGDDIGIPQVSAYTRGLMGYQTPHIDRIANEGALFTDSYGQQSCTAGRASFILGQEPFRTGLLTIGMPGGQVDYVRGATLSPGGRSIIALPATAAGGRESRITAALSGPVTTSHSDVDIVVTEYGAAELRGRGLSERAKALIAIAHPDFREGLARAVHGRAA